MRYQRLSHAPGPRPGGVLLFRHRTGPPVEAAENRRRYVVLAEGEFGEPGSKTAMGVIKYGHDPVVAVIDSTRAGRDVSEWLGLEHAAPVVERIDQDPEPGRGYPSRRAAAPLRPSGLRGDAPSMIGPLTGSTRPKDRPWAF